MAVSYSGPSAEVLVRLDRRDVERKTRRTMARATYAASENEAEREAVVLALAGYGVATVMRRTGVSELIAALLVTGG